MTRNLHATASAGEAGRVGGLSCRHRQHLVPPGRGGRFSATTSIIDVESSARSAAVYSTVPGPGADSLLNAASSLTQASDVSSDAGQARRDEFCMTQQRWCESAVTQHESRFAVMLRAHLAVMMCPAPVLTSAQQACHGEHHISDACRHLEIYSTCCLCDPLPRAKHTRRWSAGKAAPMRQLPCSKSGSALWRSRGSPSRQVSLGQTALTAQG